MKYKTDDTRFAAGFDAGSIIDGTVEQDPDTKEWVIVDRDGFAFSVQRALQEYSGKQIRLTCVSMEAMDTLQKMLSGA